MSICRFSRCSRWLSMAFSAKPSHDISRWKSARNAFTFTNSSTSSLSRSWPGSIPPHKKELALESVLLFTQFEGFFPSLCYRRDLVLDADVVDGAGQLDLAAGL